MDNTETKDYRPMLENFYRNDVVLIVANITTSDYKVIGSSKEFFKKEYPNLMGVTVRLITDNVLLVGNHVMVDALNGRPKEDLQTAIKMILNGYLDSLYKEPTVARIHLSAPGKADLSFHGTWISELNIEVLLPDPITPGEGLDYIKKGIFDNIEFVPFNNTGGMEPEANLANLRLKEFLGRLTVDALTPGRESTNPMVIKLSHHINEFVDDVVFDVFSLSIEIELR